MSFITLIVVISILVFVHEFGHFIVAKKLGVRVDEFSIGFPPRIWSKKYGETKYSINLIPFGGYVKIFGENPNEENTSGLDSERSFVNAKKWKQGLVLLSGILFNILFAWILISASFMFGSLVPVGERASDYSDYIKESRVLITKVMPNSPASLVGLKEGNQILAVRNSFRSSSV